MLSKWTESTDITLKNDREKSAKLRDYYKPGNLVVFFYPKDKMPSSTKESCLVHDNYQHFRNLIAQVFGISCDRVEANKVFKENYNIPFALPCDNENKAREAFLVPRALGIFWGRVTLANDQQGIIQLSFFDQFNLLSMYPEVLELSNFYKDH